MTLFDRLQVARDAFDSGHVAESYRVMDEINGEIAAHKRRTSIHVSLWRSRYWGSCRRGGLAYLARRSTLPRDTVNRFLAFVRADLRAEAQASWKEPIYFEVSREDFYANVRIG